MDVHHSTNHSLQYSEVFADTNATAPADTDWPLEAVVSIVVPFFFGMIGLAGLLGNALVVLGEFL